MADITAIKSGDIVIDILNPGTKAPIGLRISVMSVNDDRMKRARDNVANEGLRKQNAGKPWKVDEVDDNKMILMIAATTGWNWYQPDGDDVPGSFDGEQLEFNPKNAKRVYSVWWIRDQIDEEIGETEGFFRQ